MKTGVMTVLLTTLSLLSLISTANAGDFFPHGFDGRAREIHFDRGDRFSGERFGRERAARQSFGREHEVRTREREGRELHSIGRVQPLPYFTSAVGTKR